MLSKKNRLTKRGSFAYIYKNGASCGNNILRLFYVRSQGIKIGFSVSNKLGKATVRNKIKRRLRAAVRDSIKDIKGGCQMIFVAKQPVIESDYSDIAKSVVRLLDKSGMTEDNRSVTDSKPDSGSKVRHDKDGTNEIKSKVTPNGNN